MTALDPAQGAFTTYPAGYEVAYCLYDRLVDFDENLKFVPQLAESLGRGARPQVHPVPAPEERRASTTAPRSTPRPSSSTSSG